MVRLASFLVLFGFLFSCQQKPTRTIEESVNVFDRPIVLLDTRRSLDYSSYHISGAKDLWWQDFVIVDAKTSNSRKRKYFFEKDMTALIERLANRGLSPEKTVYLIGYKQDSTENKRWSWLLKLLDIQDVRLISMDAARKKFTGRRAEPGVEKPWALKTSFEFQDEFIIKKASECFIAFDDDKCK